MVYIDSTSARDNLVFDYDAMGNRIAKHVYDTSDVWKKSLYYSRDAQGNVMGVYVHENIDSLMMQSYRVTERSIYGSDRMGLDRHEVELIAADSVYVDTFSFRNAGNKHYELKNHLGNVLAVVSDRVTAVADSTDTTQVGYYSADILNVTDYTPFGVQMKERTFDIAQLQNGIEKPDFQWNFYEGDTTEVNESLHNATLYNGTTLTDDKCNIESAFETDGTDDYIQINDHSDFDPGTADFTVSIWVKKLSASSGGTNNYVVSKSNDVTTAGSSEWALLMSSTPTGAGAGGIAVESGTTQYYAIGTAPVSLNEWNHLVGMRDGDTIRFFKNGVLEASTYIGGISLNNVGADILIGKVLPGVHTNAVFDDFAYYQKALTQEQVTKLYGAGCDFYTPQLAYRYGFQGQEKDDEVKGEGKSYTTEFRQYDPRLARWLSIDPLNTKYPHLSPYVAFDNNPLFYVDKKGGESVPFGEPHKNYLGAEKLTQEKLKDIEERGFEFADYTFNESNSIYEIVDNEDVYAKSSASGDQYFKLYFEPNGKIDKDTEEPYGRYRLQKGKQIKIEGNSNKEWTFGTFKFAPDMYSFDLTTLVNEELANIDTETDRTAEDILSSNTTKVDIKVYIRPGDVERKEQIRNQFNEDFPNIEKTIEFIEDDSLGEFDHKMDIELETTVF